MIPGGQGINTALVEVILAASVSRTLHKHQSMSERSYSVAALPFQSSGIDPVWVAGSHIQVANRLNGRVRNSKCIGV